MSELVAITNVLIHPLFYDALSGEFEPLSDPMGRKHTLGRLAFASCVKGEITDTHDLSDFTLLDRTYSPSWAPAIKATVSGDIGRDRLDETTFTLRELSISTDQTAHNHLSIRENQHRGEVFGVEINDSHFSVDLGESLLSVRSLIADEAQKFFDDINALSL
jgi:hypothetical protein